MASFRKPGPIGLDNQTSDLDDGTLVRVLSPRPGVLGLGDVRAQPAPAEPAPGGSAEDPLIQSLQSRTEGFPVEGNRFRLIRADEWPRFRNDSRYEFVPQREARQVLERRAAVSTISPSERAALQRAASLLADTDFQVRDSVQVRDSALLLLRIHADAGQATAAESESPATPSQPPKRWIDVAIDERPKRPAPPVTPEPPPLSFYEVVVLDELERAIAGVEVELTTPNGTQRLVTDGAGLVRVDEVPPGTGSAHIVSAQQLFDVLRDRVDLDPRRTPLPEDGDLLVVTPRRVETSVSFPDATTQRIMVVNRTNIVWGSVVEHWGDLMLLSDEGGPSRLAADALTATLKLSSTGDGPSALIGLPPSGVDVGEGETGSRDITGATITDSIDQNARLAIDIDALNEALFGADFSTVGSLLGVAADEPPPAPPPPDFPLPSEEGVDFAAELAVLALQGIADSLAVPEEQV
jgi:hypothetical protein